MSQTEKLLKNDPWKLRDELVERGREALYHIADNINPSESLFFYEKHSHAKKHVAVVTKQLLALENAIKMLETV